MEIKIEKSSLQEGLAWVQNVVDRKTTMPILSNVLIEAKSGTISLTATDLEVGVSGVIQAEVLNAGKACIPAKALYEIVKELPEQWVHLNVKENFWVEIHCAKSQFKLVGMDPKEFPGLPKKTEGVEFHLDVAAFLEMVRKVDFAVSSDETRYNLNGILIEGGERGEKSTIKLVATDGHRLSISEKETSKKIPLGQGVLFPRKGVAELKRLLDDQEGNVHFWISPKQAFIDKDEKMLFVRLIDGQFPPYAHVVPQKQKRILSVAREALKECLRRVAVVTTDRSRGVKFSVSPGNLEISASNPDLGEAREELTAQYKGPTFSVGFNAVYFAECLGVLEDEQVVLQLEDDVSPCLIRSEFDAGFTHVIMPMRI